MILVGLFSLVVFVCSYVVLVSGLLKIFELSKFFFVRMILDIAMLEDRYTIFLRTSYRISTNLDIVFDRNPETDSMESVFTD